MIEDSLEFKASDSLLGTL